MTSLNSFDVAELNRLRHKLDTIQGPGVVNTPSGIYINPPPVVASRPGAAPSPRGPFLVLLTVDGGSAGGSSSTASWTYTCTDLSGNPLADGSNSTATTKTPIWNAAMWRVTNVSYTAAGGSTPGEAYYDNASPPNLILLLAPETPGEVGCPASS